MNLLTFDLIVRDFLLVAPKPYTFGKSPAGLDGFVFAAPRLNSKVSTIKFGRVFILAQTNRPGKRANVYPALTTKKGQAFRMAIFNLPHNSPSGQNSPLTIQRKINDLRRRICEADKAFLRLLAERRELEASLLEATQCYQDSLNAGALAEQGAAAVEAWEGWLEL